MRCKYCEEYTVDDYDDCEEGELCPNCEEYHIPVTKSLSESNEVGDE
jgi:hypothetical protein